MKIPKLRRKKLRATTAARRSLRASAETYDEVDEPNMKLSRALLIVLVLHVVAVSGIVAFNAIKTRQGSYAKTAPVQTPRQDAKQLGQDAHASRSAPSTLASAKPAVHSPERATEHVSKPFDSAKSYVVVKGDNPVTIAKKFNVAYDDLMELNHIDDPRKLQIGTKLLIPKAAKDKKDAK